MSRLTTLVALSSVVAVGSIASTADAGWSNNLKLQKGINLAKSLANHHGINPPPGRPPVRPPVIGAPPVCKPIVRPPVHPPIHPPVQPPICIRPIEPPPVVCPPPVVERPAPTTAFRPVSFPSAPQPAVVPTRTWYFGMSLEITNTVYGRGLRIASITPGAPAALAGLEIGDVLMVASGQSLSQANTNEHGVQILQSLVDPQYANIQLGLLDVRTQQPTYLTVMPQRVGGGPAPTATFPQAPGQAFPAPPASAPVASATAPARAF